MVMLREALHRIRDLQSRERKTIMSREVVVVSAVRTAIGNLLFEFRGGLVQAPLANGQVNVPEVFNAECHESSHMKK